MKRKTIVGVMGPGKEARESDIEIAYQIGKLIALEGWYTLSGGVASGVMQAATKGAKDNGGATIGIIPREDSVIAESIDIAIITDMGAARNNINALTSDVIIAVGIGPGTATEVCFALSPRAQKPVILVNCSEEGEKFFISLNSELVRVTESAEEAVEMARELLKGQG